MEIGGQGADLRQGADCPPIIPSQRCAIDCGADEGGSFQVDSAHLPRQSTRHNFKTRPFAGTCLCGTHHTMLRWAGFIAVSTCQEEESFWSERPSKVNGRV